MYEASGTGTGHNKEACTHGVSTSAALTLQYTSRSESFFVSVKCLFRPPVQACPHVTFWGGGGGAGGDDIVINPTKTDF